MKKIFFFLLIFSLAALIALVMAFVGYKTATPLIYFDFPSLLIVLVFVVIPLVWSGSLKDIAIGFNVIMDDKKEYTLEQLKNALATYIMVRKALVLSAIFAALIGTIALLGQLGDLLNSLGPSLAVVMLTTLYAVIIMIFLLPIQLKLEKTINMHT